MALVASITDHLDLDGIVGYTAPIIAVDETDLYMLISWIKPTTALRDGVLLRLSLRSGEIARLFPVPGGGSAGVQGLAISGGHIVFSQGPQIEDGKGRIVRLDRDGGEPTVLAETMGNSGSALVTHGTNVYFVDDEGTKRVAIEGGEVRRLTTLRPFTLGADEGALYLADHAGHAIVAISSKDGVEMFIVEEQQGPLYPIACDGDLCWLNSNRIGEAAVMRRSPDGRIATVGAGLSEPHALVFDGRDFFVAAGAGGLALYRIPASGGTPAVVYVEEGLTHIAVNDSCLFWSSASTVSTVSRDAEAMLEAQTR
jgi:hypothetical protein